MKKLLLIFLTTFSVSISAIDFAPIGAKWYYSQAGIIDMQTYKTIESVADTVIEGKSCRKLIEISRTGISPVRPFRYMYSENDSVFEYYNHTFHLLYNFRAQKGDSITIDAYPRKMYIDSTGTLDINGHILKVQYVTCTDRMSFDFSGKVIEGIGNLTFMFPTFDFNYDGPLRCFSDPIIGSYINPVWNSIDCDRIETSIENKYESKISANFIEGSTGIQVTGIKDVCAYELVNIQGRKMRNGMVGQNGIIPEINMPRGIYFIKIHYQQTLIVRKIINSQH